MYIQCGSKSLANEWIFARVQVAIFFFSEFPEPRRQCVILRYYKARSAALEKDCRLLHTYVVGSSYRFSSKKSTYFIFNFVAGMQDCVGDNTTIESEIHRVTRYHTFTCRAMDITDMKVHNGCSPFQASTCIPLHNIFSTSSTSINAEGLCSGIYRKHWTSRRWCSSFSGYRCLSSGVSGL